ncbi:MAG: glutamate--cysteine ligase [Myxococcales bacterium]|nr:glutamate--cysteine ligase [Myxococcales bacterium]
MSEQLHLFEGFGIELEYMIVDRQTLAVRPICDELLRDVCGSYELEIERGELAWSNELALHVVEIKTNGPTPSLDDPALATRFQQHVVEINELLAARDAMLMPSAMHPTMDSERELRLWPHEASPIYEALHAVFDCRGHGWANLQSQHINLPFCGDGELRQLHAAIRIVLPLLPALAASSPLVDGAPSGLRDTRLHYYRDNAHRVPSVTGHVIPERLYTREAYEKMLKRIYNDLALLDPDGILAHEWINARGAIVRFDRGAIEIRLLDTQETPAADLAVARAVVAVVRALGEGRTASLDALCNADERLLARVLDATISDAEDAIVDDARYLALLGYEDETARAGDLWQHLLGVSDHAGDDPLLDVIFQRGTLASRLLDALGDEPSEEHIQSVYRRLCSCLAEDRSYLGES